MFGTLDPTLHRLSRFLVGVTSLHDVSIIVHLPEAYVRDLHKQLTKTWNDIGGVRGVREQYLVSVMIANWVADNDYPNVSTLLRMQMSQNLDVTI